MLFKIKHFKCVVLYFLMSVGPSYEEEEDGKLRIKVPVKRLHSRHRRYIAPGARWDLLAGWETLNDSFDIHFYLLVKYYMDYLFGGQTAFNALVAANNAANTAFVNTKASTIAGVPITNAGFVGSTGLPQGAPEGLSPGKRRRRNSGDDHFPFKIEDNINNVLSRTLADDQVEVMERLEEALNRTGVNGRQCILRAICELKETPIHDKSLFGETVTLFLMPKKDNHTKLDEFKKAEQIGGELGDCWSFYPKCPYSIFSLIPGVTRDGEEELEYVFDKIETGSSVSKDDFVDEIKNIYTEMQMNNLNFRKSEPSVTNVKV